MPVCILDVSYLLISSLTNNLCVLGGDRVVPKSTQRPIHQLSAILKMKKIIKTMKLLVAWRVHS